MPLSADDDGDGFEEYVKVYDDAPLPDVVKIVLEFLQAVRHASAKQRAVDLGEAGESRLDQMAHLIKRHFFFKRLDKFRSFRTRADEAHIVSKDIPKLRQFVYAQFS